MPTAIIVGSISAAVIVALVLFHILRVSDKESEFLKLRRQKDISDKSQDVAIKDLLDTIINQRRSDSIIDDLVQKIGKYYDADRAYVFERDPLGKYTVNTYEWCAEGVNPEKDNLQQVPLKVIELWIEEFRKNGSFYISCDDEYAKKEPITYEVLEPQGIQNLIAAPMMISGDIIGFLGVDNPKKNLDHTLYISVAATTIHQEIHILKEKEIEEKYRKDLEKSREIAEAANRSKSDFLFSMSHDIRTPMNAIIGYTNLIEKNYGDKAKCFDYINKVKSSSGFLLDLINNVLEMAKIESGYMSLDEAVVDVEKNLNAIYVVFEEQMKEKDITYSCSSFIQHRYIYSDSLKVREVFLNILSNALKYTPNGGKVSMEVREIPSDKDGYCVLETTISDTGIGMSKEYIPHIFEEFSREKNNTESKIQGTGLGMPIVKRIVDFLGGTVTVESEPGEGSTFKIRLYHKIAKESELKKSDNSLSAKYGLEGLHVLMAEDNDLNAEIAEEILKEAGMIVERAEDGIICVDMLSKAEPGYYDLILMDIQMPNMDGYKATQSIRGFENMEKASIPIIAMTANAFDEDRRHAMEAGMNGHIAKPIKVNVLFETISWIVDKKN